MSRRPSVFTQSDVARAVKGVQDAGANVAGVEIQKDGTIRVLTTPQKETLAPRPEPRL